MTFWLTNSLGRITQIDLDSFEVVNYLQLNFSETSEGPCYFQGTTNDTTFMSLPLFFFF